MVGYGGKVPKLPHRYTEILKFNIFICSSKLISLNSFTNSEEMKLRSYNLFSHIRIPILLIFLFLNSTDAFCSMGYLDIISVPDGVNIYINGKFVGKTPITGLEVQSGEVRVRAIKEGYGTASKSINIKPDDITSLRIPMKPSKEKTGKRQEEIVISQDVGALLVINQLGAVPVYIDGKKKGEGSISITDISTGTHDLKVGNVIKPIRIYKNHQLKVKAANEKIIVLNDLNEINKRKTAERLRKQKADEERKRQADIERRERLKAEAAQRKLNEERARMLENTCIKVRLVADWASCRKGNSVQYGTSPGYFGFNSNLKKDGWEYKRILRKYGEKNKTIRMCNPPITDGLEFKFDADAVKEKALFGDDTTLWEDSRTVKVNLVGWKTKVIDAMLSNENIKIRVYDE
jgi:hypothetical protein